MRSLRATMAQVRKSVVAVRPITRHHPWVVLVLAGSLTVENLRAAPLRRL